MKLYLLFATFFIFAIIAENAKSSLKIRMLPFAILILSWIAATRDVLFWPDSLAYLSFFNESPVLSNYSIGDKPATGYTDKGFYLLQVFMKTQSSNYIIFFFTVAVIGLTLVCDGLRKYAIFPLFGLAIYISRFYMGRQLIQIRSGIAISIVFWAMQYVTQRKLVKYTIAIYIASLFHFSAWIAYPAYFLNMITFRKRHIIWGVIISYVLAIYFTPAIRSIVADSASDIQGAQNYVQESNSYKSAGVGLSNPMVYYQTIILLIFTFLEEKLKNVSAHYYTLRNGYFYSTCWLITLSSYAILSGRGSTILATYEILIIPMFSYVFNKRNRIVGYFTIGIFALFWFYMNMTKRL